MTLGADGMAVGEWSPVQPCGAATPDAAGGFDAWLHPYNRKDGSVGSRLLLSTVGAALQLLSPSAGAAPASAAWVREEALAAVTGAWMLPLPAVPIDVDDGTPFFGFGLPGVIEGVRDKLALLQLSAEDAAAKARARALRGDAYGTRQVRLRACGSPGEGVGGIREGRVGGGLARVSYGQQAPAMRWLWWAADPGAAPTHSATVGLGWGEEAAGAGGGGGRGVDPWGALLLGILPRD